VWCGRVQVENNRQPLGEAKSMVSWLKARPCGRTKRLSTATATKTVFQSSKHALMTSLSPVSVPANALFPGAPSRFPSETAMAQQAPDGMNRRNKHQQWQCLNQAGRCCFLLHPEVSCSNIYASKLFFKWRRNSMLRQHSTSRLVDVQPLDPRDVPDLSISTRHRSNLSRGFYLSTSHRHRIIVQYYCP